MGKLIAFVGAPGAGKTSVAMKTAVECYCNTKSNTIYFLSPDLTVPALGILFPNYTPDDLTTLVDVFDSTDMSEESILAHSVTVKAMKDFGVLGFKTGETKYSMPEPTPEKVNDFFSVLTRNSEFVFVDCSDDSGNVFSNAALTKADVIVRVVTPDLKGMTWYSTNQNLYGSDGRIYFNVINVTDKELYLPIDEVAAKVGNISAILPYSRQLKQQMLDGSMYDRLKDGNYSRKLKPLVQAIMTEG